MASQLEMFGQTAERTERDKVSASTEMLGPYLTAAGGSECSSPKQRLTAKLDGFPGQIDSSSQGLHHSGSSVSQPGCPYGGSSSGA